MRFAQSFRDSLIMSRCSLIKNGFYWVPNATHGTSTYCCADDDLAERTKFLFSDWQQKRKHEIAEYKQSKTQWVDSCYSCQNYEKFNDGSDSMRISSNSAPWMQDENDFSIREAIIRTSTICNLACKMCGPQYSSKWSSILKNNNAHKVRDNMKVPVARQLEEMTDDDLMYMKKYVLTKDLRTLLFSGGEVLLSEWNKQILDYMIEKNYCKNIDCHITTNGTIPFKDTWLDAVMKFKSCSVEFSVDGTDATFNYIRPGHTYQKLLSNIMNLYNSIKHTEDTIIQFNLVVQAHNAHSVVNDIAKLNKLLTILNNGKVFGSRTFTINPLITPTYLSLNILPPVLFEKYQLSSIIADEYDDYKFDPQLAKRFFAQSRWMDQAQQTNLKHLNPDFFNTEYYDQDIIDAYFDASHKPWEYQANDE